MTRVDHLQYGAQPDTAMEARVDSDKVAALIGGLMEFARECHIEHIREISEAAEYGSYTASRNRHLSVSGLWLERERLLSRAVGALELFQAVGAVDPSAGRTGKPSTRDKTLGEDHG